MISLIQFEVVDSFHWLTLQEFADILAISQMTPGPISINTATYVGYEVAGITGSVVATIALCLPSVMLMVLVMLFLFKNKENHWVQSLLKGLKPVMGGLILAAALLLMNKENFVDAGWGANNFSVIICAVSFIALYFFKINPMILITLAGICGAIIYFTRERLVRSSSSTRRLWMLQPSTVWPTSRISHSMSTAMALLYPLTGFPMALPFTKTCTSP